MGIVTGFGAWELSFHLTTPEAGGGGSYPYPVSPCCSQPSRHGWISCSILSNQKIATILRGYPAVVRLIELEVSMASPRMGVRQLCTGPFRPEMKRSHTSHGLMWCMNMSRTEKTCRVMAKEKIPYSETWRCRSGSPMHSKNDAPTSFLAHDILVCSCRPSNTRHPHISVSYQNPHLAKSHKAPNRCLGTPEGF